MELGVCYYPEQWPKEWWADDARSMREMGISYVRIAEFTWAIIEPESGLLDWAWLDEAIETLHAQGLKVVLGTPTATPPKWLVDQYPDILAVDQNGHKRGFGSRRHYCFSSTTYRAQSTRIVSLMAERYGQHPAVVAWQIDNEYGCHETVLSYSLDARSGFRQWLVKRYDNIVALNQAWGTVFWSQRYSSFEEIDPPVGCVTEASPAHRLDYHRYSSDALRAYNLMQVEIVRALSPDRTVIHNFMGFFTEFDHYAVAKDLDVAAWDSYPLGYTLDRAGLPEKEKLRWMRTGHPDIPSFHHDLYRGMCNGRWWVMEQQPGPVNWAPWNLSPADGMVRLWTWQAFAHGAEVVSYFRWRQVRYGTEQMHAGLNRPDRVVDQGGLEAMQVTHELLALSKKLPLSGMKVNAPVALVFDYAGHWMGQIQPQGQGYSVIHECFHAYIALRGLGLDVDIVSPQAELQAYKLIVLPAQFHVDVALAAQLQSLSAQVVIGARGGSKSVDFAISEPLPPGLLSNLLGIQSVRVESIPPGASDTVIGPIGTLTLNQWREKIICYDAETEAAYGDGTPAVVRRGPARYLAGCPDAAGWTTVLERAANDAGLTTRNLPEGVRISCLGSLIFACNFDDLSHDWQPDTEAEIVLGSISLAPRGVSIWKRREY